MTDITSSDAPQVQNEATNQDRTSIREEVENKTKRLEALQWNEKGNIFFNQGAFDEAIQAYNKASQLDPSFGMPYSNLALTYLTQGQTAEAILLYQRSIELLSSDKDRALSWNGLGNAYRCINDYANAVAAYQKAAELDPETGGIRDGTDDFQSGASPRNAEDWDDLGELFLKMGSFDEAVNAFQKAIELEPEAGRSYGNLAYALVSLGKYKEAVPLYQKSIDLLEDNKDKAAAWNRLGNVYRKLNDYDNAIKAYQKAVVLADEGVDLLTRTRFSLLSNLTVNQ
jgi:superkiller protein 3